ncbi:DNA-protecting protein DprA, partial [bacterium]|nr:DNA-protecting protein DprA [bacterium]
CIVSGLAAGIDTVAHRSAIDSGLKTIGVIASGHNYVYPTTNRDLYKSIENGNGVVLSEYFPTVEPLRFHFPQRNRIVTGLSYGTVVAEASLKSGALISANLCLEQGRDLMCIPGLISNPNTEGIYKLLKNGAQMITCAEDILDTLGWEVQNNAKQIRLNFDTLTDAQKKVCQAIELEPKSFEIILSETKLDSDSLLVILTELELNGTIKQVEGEKYTKI